MSTLSDGIPSRPMKTILVVDDSKLYRNAIAELLRKLNCTVYEASNGLEGKDIITQNEIDLAIIDIVMPKLDGFALCRWIQENPETSSISVIICSSKDQETDKYWAGKQGADVYLTKPPQAEEIIKAVESLLEVNLVKRERTS